MVHGRCKSVGCYAMTDALMEEIYSLARESFLGGNDTFQVHAFPFRMTDENMRRMRTTLTPRSGRRSRKATTISSTRGSYPTSPCAASATW